VWASGSRARSEQRAASSEKREARSEKREARSEKREAVEGREQLGPFQRLGQRRRQRFAPFRRALDQEFLGDGVRVQKGAGAQQFDGGGVALGGLLER